MEEVKHNKLKGDNMSWKRQHTCDSDGGRVHVPMLDAEDRSFRSGFWGFIWGLVIGAIGTNIIYLFN